MKRGTVFVWAWAITAAAFTANLIVGANERNKAEEQEAAASSGAVMVDGCRIGANLALVEDGMRVVMAASNPTDRDVTVNLNYMAQSMPQTSPMSRMMPAPQTRKTGTCTLALAAGETAEKIIVVAQKTEQDDLSQPGTWTFVVSRDEIKGPVSGAGSPAVAGDVPVLEEGAAVLATLQVTSDLKSADD